jgi:hypothetical protein
MDRLSQWVQGFLSIFPLTHPSREMRAEALGEAVDWRAYPVLAGFGLFMFLLRLLLRIACKGLR